MREIKDTLGIKLTHYSKVYNMDNAQLGLIIKYLLWHENSEYILENTPEYLKSKLLKRTAEDVHSANSNRRFCGAKRTRCGASGLL